MGEKSEIKLNKRMRKWNKYKKLCYTCAGIVVAVVICAVAYNSVGKKNSGKATEVTQTVTSTQAVTQPITQQQIQTTAVQQTTAAQQATAAPVNPALSGLALAAPAVEQEFTARDYYNGSIFIGDSIVNGISYYNYLDASQVMSDGNNTTSRAAEYIGGVINANPSRVFIMVGLNDVNYGTLAGQTIADNIMSIATQLKADLPNTNVCVLSLLPVTQEFEAKPSTNVTQAAIDEVNTIVQASAPAQNITYVDVATAFKDETGYMAPEFTGNGSNIYNQYYPYLLNGIAGVVK